MLQLRSSTFKRRPNGTADAAWLPAGRRYIKADFRISGAEAARLRAANLRRLLTARKLLLVLDLDHTLLNSCRC